MTSSFPSDFIWATATAAYQIEGGGTQHGRGWSTWDEIREEKGRIEDESDATQHSGGYENWETDIQLVKQLGVSHYRISISWSRILPTGLADAINEEGVMFYLKLFEELRKNGIEPIVTLFHADWPLSLYDKGGWLNESSIQWYSDFCELCFEKYSHLVNYWITLNEIPMQAWSGVTRFEGEPHHSPTRPPPRGGDSTPYLAAHNMLLAHATVYRLYKDKLNGQGKMGIVAGGMWCEGSDQQATGRALDWLFNWTVEPIFGSNGDYPSTMRSRLDGSNNMPILPTFSESQKIMIKGSADFLGLNFYTPHLIENDTGVSLREVHGKYKMCDNDEWERISGPTSWLRNAPHALRDILLYIKNKYSNIPVLITENGCPDLPETDGVDPCDDQHRIRYIQGHLQAVQQALSLGCDVIGYTAWSLMDNFEWSDGFAVRFGLYRVDYNTPEKKRTPKKSVEYLRNVIQFNHC